ncbi:MAG: RluA family pseudouridine synthase [Clostridia bacterium]
MKKTIEINKNDAGQRIDKFMAKNFPNLPMSMLYKAIRKKDVKVNSKRCEASQKLEQGNLLYMFLHDDFLQQKPKDYDFLKAPTQLNILFEDENIMILDKKPGVLVHPDENYHFDSLIARIQHYLFDKGEYQPEKEKAFAPALINRIDRNTGGIVMAAKNSETLRIMNQKVKDREIDKFYLCVVDGVPSEKEAFLKDFLVKNEKQNRVYISNKPSSDSKTILTKYKVLKSDNTKSLVEVELLTGRTHQIRAHMASIGHPLLGDGKYGKNEINKALGLKYQALYSHKLIFNFSTFAGALEYLNHKEFTSSKPWFMGMFK